MIGGWANIEGCGAARAVGHMNRAVGRRLLSTEVCIVKRPWGPSDRSKSKSAVEPGPYMPKADEQGADMDRECRRKLKAEVRPGP